MTAYLDTSVLVKLYMDEPGADDVHQVVAEADVVATSVVAYAEARAALAASPVPELARCSTYKALALPYGRQEALQQPELRM